MASLLGASLGLLGMASYVLWKRTAPPPCTGAVFIELRPPLVTVGTYHFRLTLDGDKPCEFDVPLPTKQRVDTKACDLRLALETRVQGASTSIVGLTLGAAPDRLGFRVQLNGESLYDTEVEPHYAPWATRREESKRFCGDSALVEPACRRGSSQCAPYAATCAPEGCPADQVCCASPEQAHEYGVYAATQCSSRQGCLNRFGKIACKKDADCGESASCSDTSLARDFKPPISVCAERRTAH
jgi:hypothetical protein